MKNWKTFILISLLFTVVSCSNEENSGDTKPNVSEKLEKSAHQNTAVLIGKWELKDIDFSAYYATLSSETRVRLENDMEQQVLLIEGHTFYEFIGTNRLTVESPSEKGEMEKSNGSFKLSEDNDSLYLTLEDEIESYRIEVFNENKLVLTTKDTPDRSLTFLKSN
jgi:hypothetical protein